MDITSFGRLTAVALLLCGFTANAANFVANSSFELGASRGWTYWSQKDNSGSPLSLASQIVGAALHGTKCARIPANYSLHSKPMYLSAGVTYTLSYSAKSSPSGNTFVARVSQMGDINSGPTHSTVPPTSWTRYSHTITPAVSYWHFVNFYHFQSGLTVDVDAVQLEIGGTASAWTPHSTVEAGLECLAPYNTLFASDARQVQLSIWNEGATLTNRTLYTLYDLWNRTRATGAIINVVAPGLTTTNISLVLTGFNRIVTRLLTDDTFDEITANVLPFDPKPTVLRTNGYFATHGNYDSNQISHLRRIGFSSVRVFSPSINLFRWLFVEPSQGNFSWQADASYDAITTNGLSAIVCLSDSDRLVNPWATNGAGVLNIPAYSNYVWNAVNRYKTKVKYWEIWNEPHQSGFPWITDANNYASALGPASRAVKAADPTAKVIAFGGVVDETWAKQAWNALSAGDQANIDIFSCHLYPNDNDQWDDQNNGSVDTRPFEWKTEFAGLGREIWNTESGTWTRGGYLTDNAIWGYRFSGVEEEWLRPEEMQRSLKGVNRITREMVRCFGNGFRKFVYYDHRKATEVMMDATHSSAWELTDAHKPVSIAIQMMAYFIDEFTSGTQFAHSSSSTPEMYLFTKGVTNVVVAFNHDRINRVITVSNVNFTAFDAMGNTVPRLDSTKVIVTGTPQYFVTTSLTGPQLQATFAYSSVTSLADTNPPGLSIDIAPSGIWPGGAKLIKWTAIDDTYSNIGTSIESKTNVSFAWKFDSGTYTPLSQTNIIAPTIAAGNHTLWVKAVDRVGNVAETAYVFDPGTASDPPPPGDPPPPQPPLQATVTPSRIRGR